MRQQSIAVLILGSCLFIGSAYSQTKTDSVLALSPCHVSGVSRELQCGAWEVFENRAALSGRKISLHVVVLSATGTDRRPDPVFYFSGGPGEAATREAALVVRDWSEINEHRDIVLVDVRGTGESNGLWCPFQRNGLQQLLDGFLPAKDIRECRKQLETHADLRFYNTSLAVDDVEEVRTALGYGQINIGGGSYGTRAVQVYLRQHPDHVRTALLWDVLPVGARMPISFARDAQSALEELFAVCSNETGCHAAFPNPASDFTRVLKQLTEQPKEVEADSSSSKDRVKFMLTRDGFAQTIRFMLYSPETAALIPFQVHAATMGNFGPIAKSAYDYANQITGSIADGDYLSVTCSEDVAFFTSAEAAEAAHGTFLGDFRARKQKEACDEWPSAQVPSSFLDPVKSDVPSMLVTGDLDPVTPPRDAAAVAQGLPHHLSVIVKGGSHDFEGMQGAHCVDQIYRDFLEKGDEKEVDTSCLKSIIPVPFLLQGENPKK